MIVRAGGSLCLHPGEAHANASLGDKILSYRVFYIPPSLVPPELKLAFSSPISDNKRLFRSLVDAHLTLACSDDQLEQEQAFLCFLHALPIASESSPPGRHVHPGLAAVKAYLESHFRERPGMAELAAVAGLSPFHLSRSFRRHYGLAPAAFRNQLRVMEARWMLRRGDNIAAVALAVGFADQSHLTRLFQRVLGTTPGSYAKQ